MTRKCFAKFSEYDFYMGQTIQEQTKWNLWKTTFKIFEVMFLFKLKNGNTKRMYEICSKLTRKTPERRLKQISQIVPVFPTVDFEQTNGGWMVYVKTKP